MGCSLHINFAQHSFNNFYDEVNTWDKLIIYLDHKSFLIKYL